MTAPDGNTQADASPRAEPVLRRRNRARPVVYVLVAAYSAGILLPFLGSGRTLTRHEVMVSLPAKEMLASGDWVVPTYAQRTWLAKPPLLYWVTAGVGLLRGRFDEWTARLPAAVSAIGLCLLVAWLAGRWFGDVTALLAGLVQATCVYTFMQGRLGEIDMPFALLIAAALAVLAVHWSGGTHRLPLRSAVAFHVLAGLAVLAKGPMAFILLGGTVLGWCAVRRSFGPLRAVLATPAVLCFLLIAVPWPAAVVMRAGDEAWTTWQREYVGRFTGAYRLGSQTPFFYFLHVPWLVLPWSIVLVLGWRKLWTDVRNPDNRHLRFLWTWFLTGLVLLSLSAGKHKHYAIPILPPLSILTAKLLADGVRQLAQRARPVFASVFGVILVVYLIVGGSVMPARDHRKVTADFVRQATQSLPPDAELYVVALGHSAAYLYVARDYVYLDGLDQLPEGSEDVYALTLAAHAEEFAGTRGLTVVTREPPHESVPPGGLLVLLREDMVTESDGLRR